MAVLASYLFSQVGTTQVVRLDEDLERIAPSEVGVHQLCCVLTPIDISVKWPTLCLSSAVVQCLPRHSSRVSRVCDVVT